MSHGRKAQPTKVGTASSTTLQLHEAPGVGGPFADRPTASAPGFASQAASMSPRVQMKGGGGASGALATAAAGVQGSGSALPHKAAIESSFGADMGNVQAYTGPDAKAACDSLGASAFAMGNKVAFADSGPSVQLAAHEAAHVVQQSQGVQLSGGVGRAGDKYEVAADAAADRVSSGQSAGDLLGGGGSKVQAKEAGVQMHEDLQFNQKKSVSSKAMKRIGLAKEGIKHAKSVFSAGAGNQAEALKAGNFNSYFRMKVMRDSSCWELAGSVRALAAGNRDALTAAKADLAHGGNCGEHAQVGFDWLRVNAPGETICRSDVAGLDHAFVLMGDPSKDSDADMTVCDPWPTAATACTWEDHFAHTSDKSKINRRNSMVADGQNVKAVIAAGLKLSARGEAMCKQKWPDDKTKEELEKGLGNWIWEHPNAAATEYDYEEATDE